MPCPGSGRPRSPRSGPSQGSLGCWGSGLRRAARAGHQGAAALRSRLRPRSGLLPLRVPPGSGLLPVRVTPGSGLLPVCVTPGSGLIPGVTPGSGLLPVCYPRLRPPPRYLLFPAPAGLPLRSRFYSRLRLRPRFILGSLGSTTGSSRNPGSIPGSMRGSGSVPGSSLDRVPQGPVPAELLQGRALPGALTAPSLLS